MQRKKKITGELCNLRFEELTGHATDEYWGNTLDYDKLRPSSDAVPNEMAIGFSKSTAEIQMSYQIRTKFRMHRSHATNLLVPSRESTVLPK